MAEKFIGLTILVTLKDPPNAKVRGLVTNVVEQQLTLEKATWFTTGTFLDRLIIKGENIYDLEIEQTAPISAPPAPVSAPVDPAIISFGKPARSILSSSVSQVSAPSLFAQEIEPFTVSPPHSDRQALIQSTRGDGTDGQDAVGVLPRIQNHIEENARQPAAILTEPFDDLALNGNLTGEPGDNTVPKTSQIATDHAQNVKDQGIGEPAKRNKRGRRRGAGTKNSNALELKKADEVHFEDPQGSPTNARGPGWRHTPMVEPRQGPNNRTHPRQKQVDIATSVHEQYLSVSNRKAKAGNRHRKRRSEFDDQNGWATEEVTDIQDLGDFDFEGNLSKFDKRKVFEQIRQEDTTADEARLVSFNRTPARPGTYGGKNLHFTENVLDSPRSKHLETSNSESEVDLQDLRINSSRNSHRNRSRTSTRKVPSRKGSGIAANDLHSGSGSLVGSNQRFSKSLRTTSSSRECPCLSPLQMVELEQLVISRFGLTEDMITENAACAIAQTSRRLCSSQSEHSHSDLENTPRPFIVILTGNHKTAARAIAAARHLRNHSAQVVLCILGLEREGDFLDDVRRQLNIFRIGGGKTIRPDQLMQRLKGSSTNLIVDAMFGIHMSFHDLRFDDQAAYLQLLRWANSMNAAKLSIDIPSGVDASTGQPSTNASTEIVIMADHVLSLGAPKNGLLLGLEKVDSFKNHLTWLVADIGISSAAWKKFGLRRQQGVDFGPEWVTALEFGEGTGA